MNRTQRTLSRIAGLALVLTGASLFTAGQASANDRAVVVSCTDQSAGTWTVSVTFSGIEVRADRPVEVSLGSDSATLTEPGANGTVTLQQNFGAGQAAATLTWSVVRLDYQNMGVLNLDRPVECTVTPTTEAPPVDGGGADDGGRPRSSVCRPPRPPSRCPGPCPRPVGRRFPWSLSARLR